MNAQKTKWACKLFFNLFFSCFQGSVLPWNELMSCYYVHLLLVLRYCCYGHRWLHLQIHWIPRVRLRDNGCDRETQYTVKRGNNLSGEKLLRFLFYFCLHRVKSSSCCRNKLHMIPKGVLTALNGLLLFSYHWVLFIHLFALTGQRRNGVTVSEASLLMLPAMLSIDLRMLHLTPRTGGMGVCGCVCLQLILCWDGQ